MLLANFENCRIGSRCGEGGGVERPCLVVRRGRREDFVDRDFGRETTSAHDIEFRGVASEIACEVDEVGAEDIVTEVGDVASEDSGENFEVAGGEDEVAKGGEGFGFFACFVRTCS